MSSEVIVEIRANYDPLVLRVFSILKDRIQQRCSSIVVEKSSGGQVILSIDKNLPQDAFRIDQIDTAVQIAGGSPRGLLYGVGKFLRTSRYDGAFQASQWRGTSVPQGSLRGMYFATHFHNWYHQASEAEIQKYVEDIALWGVNAIMVIFPMINLEGWDDPQTAPAIEMVKCYAKATKDLGLMFATGINNTMFRGAPSELLAAPLPDPTGRRGNSGFPICPSNPDGHEYIMENARILFEKLSDVGLDILCYWPYDEGGCSCEKCMPWGSNAFLKMSCDLTKLGREYFPDMKTVLSTWMFDTPPEGEWQGLADALAIDNKYIDYILADSHEDFPRYPLDAGVPGNLPLINFPEISMWGNDPWGGMGAHPLPARFQRLWDQVKHVVKGGFPYSEGIYEDISKVITVQFYWDHNQSAQTTLEEYIAYEFSPEVTKDVLTIIDILEIAAGNRFKGLPVNSEDIATANEMAEVVNNSLPEWAKHNWRWEILYLRTVLERELSSCGLETPKAEAAMMRLMEIYHCMLETDDPYHHRVRPPLKRAVTHGREC